MIVFPEMEKKQSQESAEPFSPDTAALGNSFPKTPKHIT